mmetsp:Transcript_34411/g.91427  ORF Transcript_34411/g.91427 Transcript_34411/m.91427 type:complete len:330 (-) Transcript_34411:243-1232(-)
MAASAGDNSSAGESRTVDECEAWKVREALLHGASRPVSGKELRAALRNSYVSVSEGHRALTETWGAPLSLYDDSAEAAAARRGVPARAIIAARLARQLVEESACLGDLTDAYEAQIVMAHRESRGVRRDALLEHLDACEELAGRLRGHLLELRAARASFDSPPIVGAAAAADAVGGMREGEVDATGATFARASGGPTVILEPVKKELISVPPMLRSLWRGVKKTSNELMPRALELAVDAVDFCLAATSGGASAMSTAAPAPAAEQARRPPWDETRGRPSAWLGLEEDYSASKREPLLGTRPVSDGPDAGSAQSRWERSRRRSDRRWTMP